MRRIETVAATFRGEPCMEYVYAISKEEGLTHVHPGGADSTAFDFVGRSG